MDGTLRVEPSVLLNKASEFESARTHIMSLFDEMTAKVTALNSVWEGEAAATYQNRFGQLNDDILHLNNLILEHVRDLNEMATIYSTVGTDVETIIEGLPTDILKS